MRIHLSSRVRDLIAGAAETLFVIICIAGVVVLAWALA